MEALKSKNSKLESLCRAMQSERNELREQIKQQEQVTVMCNYRVDDGICYWMDVSGGEYIDAGIDG